MNKFYSLVFLGFLIMFLGCSPTPEQASKYNNALIKEQRAVVSKMDELIASFNTYNSQRMHQAYNALLNQINQSIAHVSKMQGFDGSTAFRDSTLSLLRFYKAITTTELRTVMELLSKPEDKYTASDAKRVAELMSDLSQKVAAENQRYRQFQEKFAKKYKLNLTLKEE
jgi:hypothetical protein